LFGLPMPDIFPVNGEAVSSASAAHSSTSKTLAILIVIHFIAQHKVVKANWRRFSGWATKLGSKS